MTTLTSHGRILGHYHLLARVAVAVAAVYNNAIIVIGGCTEGGTTDNAISSSLTVVELGQAELLH